MNSDRNNDWRADIRLINNLYDIDPWEQMIFLRHQYLLFAKDLINSDDIGDQELGEECCEVAEALELAIEIQCEDVRRLIEAEPAWK